MKRYIGLKVIHAEPMNRIEYCTKRGWDVPADENPYDEGYIVQYLDNHISWLPKDVFEGVYKKADEVIPVQHDLLTSKYTRVFHEKEYDFNAPHHFEVWANQGPNAPYLVGSVNFQEGPIKENGVNGVCNEDLIAMVICSLEHFQRSPYKSRDNAMAITKLEEALLWLRKRTIGRENRGVEGTSEI